MNILIVENDEALGSTLVQVVETYNWGQGYLAASYGEACELLNSVRPDVALVDYFLNEDGEFERVLEILGGVPKIIMMTASKATAEILREQYPNHHVIKKPFDLDELSKILL